MSTQDFSAFHAAMKLQIDQQIVSGLSTVPLQNRKVIDGFCDGHADKEAFTAP